MSRVFRSQTPTSAPCKFHPGHQLASRAFVVQPKSQPSEGVSPQPSGFRLQQLDKGVMNTLSAGSAQQPKQAAGQPPLSQPLTPVVQQSGHPPVQRFLDDIWDTITDAAGAIWETVTHPANADHGDSDNPQPSQAQSSSQLEVPQGKFTITDGEAIIRRPPPALAPEKGKPLIAQGSEVTLLEGFRKNGKDYVKVSYQSSATDPEIANQSATVQEVWTSATNIEGLPATILKLNPQTADPAADVVVPKNSGQDTPGLPEKPQIEDASFAAIVQELEHMEQHPLGVEKKHGEETGTERTERVEKIASLRQRIAALTETLSELEASQIQQVQAYLYRRLMPLAPYFGQMANTNILEKGSKGWDRTCNVTVPAMVVEGLGKTKSDYVQANQPFLKQIFNALEGKYKVRKHYDAATDFDALRLPDFMALVGIAKHMPEGSTDLADQEFIDAVSKARQKAAQKTTYHATMMYLIEQFGCSHSKGQVHSKALDTIGTAQKAYTKAVLRGKNPEDGRALYEKIEAIEDESAKAKAFEALTKNEKKQYQVIWKYEQFNKEQADTLLPVNTYRDAVLKKINPLLDKGSQILVGMEQHFVRLDGLDENTVQVDDPGEKGFKNLQVTWEQARNLGYFKGFWEITT